MNVRKVKEIIESYKKHFAAINKEEIYKWRAVKHFQDNWDLNSGSFPEMLEHSLAYANNLLASGQYFPKQMITQYARMDAGAVRRLFAELYNENSKTVKTLEERWIDFHAQVENLNKRFFAESVGKSYQDHRAFMVYLALRFPEQYFLFKFKMFKEFVRKIDFPYKPATGRVENLTVYSNLCKMLREEIVRDEELLALHKARIGEEHYLETSYNILTQDVIYATVRHLDKFENAGGEKSAIERLVKIDKPLISVVPNLDSPAGNSKAAKIDYAERQRINKRLGDFGEQLVFRYEQEKLERLGSKKTPQYVALTDDGRGYDILSYDERGEEIYIEVKTTAHSCDAPFFITAGELTRSIEAKDKYCLYRVYDYDEMSDTGKFRKRTGSLESLCTEPVLYKISAGQDGVVLNLV